MVLMALKILTVAGDSSEMLVQYGLQPSFASETAKARIRQTAAVVIDFRIIIENKCICVALHGYIKNTSRGRMLQKPGEYLSIEPLEYHESGRFVPRSKIPPIMEG